MISLRSVAAAVPVREPLGTALPQTQDGGPARGSRGAAAEEGSHRFLGAGRSRADVSLDFDALGKGLERAGAGGAPDRWPA